MLTVTRQHKVGITSNRESERHGEFMYLSLIHTARHMLGGSFILRKIKQLIEETLLEFIFQGKITNWYEVVTR